MTVQLHSNKNLFPGVGAADLHRKRVLLLQKKLLQERRRQIKFTTVARQKKTRACWVRPLLLGHDTLGPWATTIPLMKEQDTDKFYTRFRMTPKAFDTLLAIVGPHLGKKSWRKPICPGERLAIFLRYDTSKPLNLKSQNSKLYVHSFQVCGEWTELCVTGDLLPCF